jgi:hypothetical protein
MISWNHHPSLGDPINNDSPLALYTSAAVFGIFTLMRIAAIVFFIVQVFRHIRVNKASKNQATTLTLLLIALSITGFTLGISIVVGCQLYRNFSTIVEPGDFCDGS